jgi:FkbM family methyltransferase
MLKYLRRHYHPLWRLRQSGFFRWFQARFDPEFRFHYKGIKVWGKLIRNFSTIASPEGQEAESTRIFSEQIQSKNSELFLDIGANIGLYSWIAVSHRVKEIYLFEPDLINVGLLAKTIKGNSLEACCIIPMAMGKQIGMARFFPDSASGATGSLKDYSRNKSSLHHAYGMGDYHSVPTITLDAFIDLARGKRTLIKIDVEGAEMDVLAGGMQFIESIKPHILMESFDREGVSALEAMGYTSQVLDENHNYLLSP